MCQDRVNCFESEVWSKKTGFPSSKIIISFEKRKLMLDISEGYGYKIDNNRGVRANMQFGKFFFFFIFTRAHSGP